MLEPTNYETDYSSVARVSIRNLETQIQLELWNSDIKMIRSNTSWSSSNGICLLRLYLDVNPCQHPNINIIKRHSHRFHWNYYWLCKFCVK